MAYATRAELMQLGIATDALSEVAEASLEQALESASRLADSYLRTRYSVPLAQADGALKLAVCQLGAYTALCARGFNPSNEDGDSIIRQMYRDAIAWLKDVSAGKAVLLTEGGAEVGAGDDGLDELAFEGDEPRGWT